MPVQFQGAEIGRVSWPERYSLQDVVGILRRSREMYRNNRLLLRESSHVWLGAVLAGLPAFVRSQHQPHSCLSLLHELFVFF